jgi:hypothetical protein
LLGNSCKLEAINLLSLRKERDRQNQKSIQADLPIPPNLLSASHGPAFSSIGLTIASIDCYWPTGLLDKL